MINKEAIEQPNCEGCEFFKHSNKDEHCYRYTQELSSCKLRQEPVEQPPASKLQCPECGKRDTDVIVDIANFGGNDIYVPVHRCKCGFKWTDDVAGNVWDKNNALIQALLKEQPPASEFTTKIRKRWLAEALNKDSTLDYAICAVIDLCDRLDAEAESHRRAN